MKKMREPTVFKTLNMRQQRKSDCEMENKQDELCFPELTTQESFQAVSREEESRQSDQFPGFRDQGSQNLYDRIPERKATHRVNSGGLQRVSFEYSAEKVISMSCEETVSPDRELHRELEGTKVPDAHTRPGILPIPTNKVGKPQDSWSIEQTTQKALG